MELCTSIHHLSLLPEYRGNVTNHFTLLPGAGWTVLKQAQTHHSNEKGNEYNSLRCLLYSGPE